MIFSGVPIAWIDFSMIDSLSVSMPKLLLLDERQNLKAPAAMLLRRDLRHAVDVAHVIVPTRATRRGQNPIGVGVILSSQGELLEMVHASASAGPTHEPLARRASNSDQHADDGNDDEKFNQRETRERELGENMVNGAE